MGAAVHIMKLCSLEGWSDHLVHGRALTCKEERIHELIATGPGHHVNNNNGADAMLSHTTIILIATPLNMKQLVIQFNTVFNLIRRENCP